MALDRAWRIRCLDGHRRPDERTVRLEMRSAVLFDGVSGSLSRCVGHRLLAWNGVGIRNTITFYHRRKQSSYLEAAKGGVVCGVGWVVNGLRRNQHQSMQFQFRKVSLLSWRVVIIFVNPWFTPFMISCLTSRLPTLGERQHQSSTLQ